jgi:hypothetical protein
MMKTKLTLFVAVLAVALFGMGCASTEPAFVSDGLVAYYPFNGNAKDESGNGHDGKLVEARGARVKLSKDRHGADNSAYNLNGPTSGFDVGEFDFNPITKITISCWVNLAERNVRKVEKDIGDPEYGIFLGGGSNEDDFHFLIWQNRLQIGARFKGGSDGFGHHRTLKNTIPLNQWIHAVLTSDGKQIYYFIDGVAVGNYKGVPDNLIVKGKFYIGKGTPKGNFNGDIDDVRIYNRGLSSKEVKSLYDLEKPNTK